MCSPTSRANSLPRGSLRGNTCFGSTRLPLSPPIRAQSPEAPCWRWRISSTCIRSRFEPVEKRAGTRSVCVQVVLGEPLFDIPPGAGGTWRVRLRRGSGSISAFNAIRAHIPATFPTSGRQQPGVGEPLRGDRSRDHRRRCGRWPALDNRRSSVGTGIAKRADGLANTLLPARSAWRGPIELAPGWSLGRTGPDHRSVAHRVDLCDHAALDGNRVAAKRGDRSAFSVGRRPVRGRAHTALRPEWL